MKNEEIVYQSPEIEVIDVEVENVGEHPAKEVIQVYLSMPHTKLDHPYQDLVAFKKTKLLKLLRLQKQKKFSNQL